MVLTRQNFTVNGAFTVPEIIDAVAYYRPHVCLIACHLVQDDRPGMIGQLIAVSASTKVLVLGAEPDTDDGVLAALQGGASAYVHKSRAVTALTTAISRVLRGEIVVDVPKAASGRRPAPLDDMQRLAAFLTTRERECLRLLVDGLDTTRMATALGVSPATVRTHVQSLLIKLGVHSRLEAASLAVRYRLVEDMPAA